MRDQQQTFLAPKVPFRPRLHRKSYTVKWNPLLQPLTVHDFVASGITAAQLHQAAQKLAEIKAKLSPSPFLRDQLKAWFSAMPTDAKVTCLSLKAPQITWLIKHMFTRSMLFGDLLFAFEVSSPILTYTTTPDRGAFFNHPKANAERELIVGVRLADHAEPFDCFSVSEDLVENSKAFFNILTDAAGGKFGLSACVISKAENCYVWDLPPWFDYTKPNSVGSWICANIERLLWLRYGLFLTQIKLTVPPPLTPFVEKGGLADFWKNLPETEKKEVFAAAIQENTSGGLAEQYRMKEVGLTFAPEKFINWLLFIPLSDIGMHEAQCSVLNAIKKWKSDKVAKELLSENEVEKIIKTRAVFSDPEDCVEKKGKLTAVKTKKLKSEDGRVKKAKKKPRARHKAKAKEDLVPNKDLFSGKEESKIVSAELAPIDEPEEEVALNMTSNIIVGVLSKIEEETESTGEPKKVPQKIEVKSKKTPEKKVKPVPLPAPENSKPEKDPETAAESLLDAAAVEVNYYKSAHGKSVNKKHYAITEEMNEICRGIAKFHKSVQGSREKLLKLIGDKIIKVFSVDATITMYGSAQSGLAIEGSDIDLGVTGLSLYSHESVVAAIEKLEAEIKPEPYVTNLEPVKAARIPVLKVQADLAKLGSEKAKVKTVQHLQKVDIVFTDECYFPVENAVQATEFSKELLSQFKYLREVTLVLKKLLARMELNVPYKGGINSYAVLLLCAAYYAIYPEFRSPGEYLLGVLDFYAKYFNNMLYGIFFNGGCMYPFSFLVS